MAIIETGKYHLVEILLVAEGLLFLIPQLCQRLVEAVIVYQLGIATYITVVGRVDLARCIAMSCLLCVPAW